jgi:hypothetical protein
MRGWCNVHTWHHPVDETTRISRKAEVAVVGAKPIGREVDGIETLECRSTRREKPGAVMSAWITSQSSLTDAVPPMESRSRELCVSEAFAGDALDGAI